MQNNLKSGVSYMIAGWKKTKGVSKAYCKVVDGENNKLVLDEYVATAKGPIQIYYLGLDGLLTEWSEHVPLIVHVPEGIITKCLRKPEYVDDPTNLRFKLDPALPDLHKAFAVRLATYPYLQIAYLRENKIQEKVKPPKKKKR